MKNCILAVTAIAALAGAASADTVVVDLAGWQTTGGWLAAGNTNTTISVPVGSTITNISWSNLTFASVGDSWLEDLILSVNNSIVANEYWDVAPSDVGAGGVYGPASGTFGVDGVEAGGGLFTVTTGNLYIAVYEAFNDNSLGVDTTISAGTLTIEYTVPTPGAAALLGLGGLVAGRRRRA